SRARHSDLMLFLACTTPVEEVKRRTDGLSVFLVNLKESLGKGVEIRPIAAMINHNTTEVFFDNLKVPAENLIGEEGKGFRYILDGMHAERIWGELARRRCDVPDLRRLRLRQGIRHRAQMARGAALPIRAALDQPDPRLSRPARFGHAAELLRRDQAAENVGIGERLQRSRGVPQ